MANTFFVIGMYVKNRTHNVPEVQRLLTKYGCNIKSRIGLHEVHEGVCSPSGLIVLEMIGNQTDIQSFMDECSAVDGVEIQKMVFRM